MPTDSEYDYIIGPTTGFFGPTVQSFTTARMTPPAERDIESLLGPGNCEFVDNRPG